VCFVLCHLASCCVDVSWRTSTTNDAQQECQAVAVQEQHHRLVLELGLKPWVRELSDVLRLTTFLADSVPQ
jgi:hypothetical protein